MEEQRRRTPISQAVRDLRTALGNISQQDLAVRLHMAVRTVARWEADQSPRGTALLKLAELARSHGLKEVADVFRRALEDELIIEGMSVDPEVKPWLKAFHEIFRQRDHIPALWDRLTTGVVDGIRYIADAAAQTPSHSGLQELLQTLTVAAMLPAERQLKRLAEEIAAREGLAIGEAYEVARQRNPNLWIEYLTQKRNREDDRRYEQEHGFLGQEKNS